MAAAIIELKDIKVDNKNDEKYQDNLKLDEYLQKHKKLPDSDDERYKILMEKKDYVVLLTDSDLSDNERKVLSQGFDAVQVYNPDVDEHKFIDDIKTNKIFAININHGWGCLSEPKGLSFYSENQRFITPRAHVVYYRTSGAIKKGNLERLGINFIINKLPTECKTKFDCLRQILYNKPPQYRNWATRAWQWLKKHL
jgi:hypothetical protein